MFAGKTLINKICKIHHRTVQVYNECKKSYGELLQLNKRVYSSKTLAISGFGSF